MNSKFSSISTCVLLAMSTFSSASCASGPPVNASEVEWSGDQLIPIMVRSLRKHIDSKR